MEEFDIPVEDFEAIKKLILMGQPAVAAAKLRQLVEVSPEDAASFVDQLTQAEPDLKAAADAAEAAAVPSPPPPTFTPPPPVSENPAAPITRRKSWRDLSENPEIRWYHHVLEFLSIPLVVFGGLVGVFCFSVGYLFSFKLLRSHLPGPVKYGLSIVGTAMVYALYFGIAIALTRQEQGGFLLGWRGETPLADLIVDTGKSEKAKPGTKNDPKPGETAPAPTTSDTGKTKSQPADATVENLPSPETEKLFDTALSDLHFVADEGPLPILKAAADTVEFTLTESARDRKYFNLRNDTDFESVTPTELVETFQKITGRRAVIDYNAKTIDVE